MTLPRFFTVKQTFASHRIDDLAGEVTRQLAGAPTDTIAADDRVAIAVGSRGIDRIAEITGAVAGYVRSLGAAPYVIPAMGSHGGASEQGQIATLKSLGITAEAIGCPVLATMDTVELGQTESGIPLYFDAIAAKSDHLIAINRIKPHTRLTGSIQSGVSKMLMIGLGNHRGAVAFHQAFRTFDHRLDQVTDQIIPRLIEKTPFRFGIGIVEDAFDSVGKIQILPPADLLSAEPELLSLACDWMPQLPFRTAELLIIDRIGKEISGTGMDTNVIGRKWNDKIAGPDEWPKIDEIYVRSLTETTAGNASGIGIAEYTHRRAAEAIDRIKTQINCVTAAHATAAALPVWFDHDRQVLEAVTAQSCTPPDLLRWMWISDTLHLDELCCSEAYYDEATERDDLQITSPPQPMEFDPSGDLQI
ncbi:nickel-dependent lactate racemase [Stieleria sp. TO1_6]|uniref:lactate racemase domain-containing protein n=1 Tax=Stieleria tagensis TaxID=2956795 RepID=UPI00209B179E|nr:lactate racemase domain-containing protein [Stieleria tagensis]MCO8123748.1 nickel-dependent lactate racemase [Stieleria tagensis]